MNGRLEPIRHKELLMKAVHLAAFALLSACGGTNATPTPPPGSVKTQSCNSDADCKNAATPTCINNICAAKPTSGTKGIGEACSADSECLSGLVCDKGKCDVMSQATGAACKENDDCAAGLICQANQCVSGVAPDDGGAGCNDNGDCGDGGFICVGGQCVAGTAPDDAGTTSDDAGGGQACGPMGGGASCNDNGDCGTGGKCVSGQCAPTNVPCPSGMTCVSNVCQPPAGGGSDAGTSGACHPVVNELQAAGVTASDEWVEIFNPCTTTIDLKSWKLQYRSAGNNSGGSDTTILTLTQKIAAGGYLLLVGGGYTGSAPADASWAGSHLAAAGGAVGLRDSSGALIDSVAYKTLTTTNNFTEGSPAPNPPANNSIARHPNGTDTDDNSKDFQLASNPTPGAANK
jgi:hypothetical protein